jgi:pimeloyl-ACP methyl ester carboxylesterase
MGRLAVGQRIEIFNQTGMQVPVTQAELFHTQVGESSIAYRRFGHGPALVLLHGILCDSRAWGEQLAGLSDHFTVVAWDAPGAGVSSDPPGSFTITDWAECLAGFLDQIGITRAHIVGLSWGGAVAQEFYRLYPKRVLGLVLAGTYAGWKGSLSESVCEQRLARCLREASLPAEEIVGRWVPEFLTEAAPQALREAMSDIVLDFHPAGFRLMAKSLAEMDTTTLLPRIVAPTLLLWGDRDQRSSLEIAAQFRDAMPNARLAVLTGAAHISNMERPQEFNAAVRNFCLSNPPTSPGAHTEAAA